VARKVRRLVLIAVVLVVLPTTAAHAAVRMQIGFFDDPSFRWSPQAAQNLAAAAAAHASVIHALVDWATVAPTRPAHPLDGSDPAYHLSDIDALVRTAQRYDLQVLLTISDTPAWANGGGTPNQPPRNLETLTQFAEMLANRYNGTHPGFGVVRMFSIWNEPNLGLYLIPQFQGTRIVSPGEYVKLFLAAYRGIKAGDPNALVAAGETSNRGRNTPTGRPGEDSVAPATFAELVAKVDPNLPLAAWATHPDPSNFLAGPTQQVVFPNVSFSTMTRFGESLARWFHRPIPIWVTEYGEATMPQFPFGVSYARQARDARTVLRLAAANGYVQMFVWFIFRDSTSATWFSGLESANGAKKPAYAAFARTAAGLVGQTQLVAADRHFTVMVAVPFMDWHGGTGSVVGLTWAVRSSGGETLAAGQAREHIEADEEVSFPVAFDPVKQRRYTLTVTFNDIGGQQETELVALLPAS
jgi:hypothetical protein